HVTVLLSGEGGDELLGGYLRYQLLRFRSTLKIARLLLPTFNSTFNLNGRFRKMERYLSLSSMDEYVALNSFELLPKEIKNLGCSDTELPAYRQEVLNEAKDVYKHDPIRQAMYVDLHTYLCSLLDRNDRMTMGASIECRVPLLDYRLVEGVAA